MYTLLGNWWYLVPVNGKKFNWWNGGWRGWGKRLTSVWPNVSVFSYTNHSSFWVVVWFVCCSKSCFRFSDTNSDGVLPSVICVVCGGIRVSRHKLKLRGMVCDPFAFPNFPAGPIEFPDEGKRVSRGNVDDMCLDEPFDSSVVWWTESGDVKKDFWKF